MSAPLPAYVHIIGIKPVGSKIQEHILIQSISLREMSENDLMIEMPEGVTKLVFISTKENVDSDTVLDNTHKFMLGSK